MGLLEDQNIIAIPKSIGCCPALPLVCGNAKLCPMSKPQSLQWFASDKQYTFITWLLWLMIAH
jgi:hypothetical protein